MRNEKQHDLFLKDDLTFKRASRDQTELETIKKNRFRACRSKQGNRKIHYVPIKTHHPEGMKLQGRRNFYQTAIHILGVDDKNDRTKNVKLRFL
jgi:hypothetical protein